MSVFQTAKHLTSWAGLTPQNAESAGKKKTTRIGKAGIYIKPLLVQLALAASRSKKHPELYIKRQILKKRRGGKKATIAIARKLLVAIYHILSKHQPYSPFVRKEQLPDSRVITQEQALALVTRLGYAIKVQELTS